MPGKDAHPFVFWIGIVLLIVLLAVLAGGSVALRGESAPTPTAPAAATIRSTPPGPLLSDSRGVIALPGSAAPVELRRETDPAPISVLRGQGFIGAVSGTGRRVAYWISSTTDGAGAVGQIAVSAIAVLGVRLVAGTTMPLSTPTIPPPSMLAEPELAVARYVAMGRTDEEIAERTQSSEKVVRRRKQTAMTKLGFEHDWELREWALAHRIIPEPPARHWYERTLVRGTLAGGGLIGLCWTSYQILKVLFPQFFH